MSNDCRNLDAYLADDLAASDAELFASHLPTCNECREAIAEQRWIDGLLRSIAVSSSELPRDDMVASLRNSIANRNRHRRLSAGGLATAAAILIALGWIALRHADDHSNNAPPVSQLTDLRPHSQQFPRATFVTESNVIAVPVASSHPDVTVIRIYPAYEPHYETRTANFEPEAPADDPWDTYTNGG